MDARTNLELGENLTWELSDEVSALREYKEQVEMYQMGLSSSTRVLRHWPESASHIRLLHLSIAVHSYLQSFGTYISPSMAQDTIRVPS